MSKLAFKIQDNTIISYIDGDIDDTLIGELIAGITERVPEFDGAYWGYVCVSNHQNIVSDKIELMLIQLLTSSWESGCIAGAYVLQSQQAIEQMNTVAKRAGSLNGIENRVFKTDAEAIQYTEKLIQDMANNSLDDQEPEA